MATALRARRRALSAEPALAFLAGTGTFAVVGFVLATIEPDVPVLLLAVPIIAAVVGLARRAGVAYAVPVAMTSVLAYDWYFIPPTHPHEFPDSENLAAVLVFAALGVAIGQIASRAGHRAAVSDAARGELAEEQAALRRIATLVARGVPPEEVFAAVAREAGQLLRVDVMHIGHYEAEDMATAVASWSAAGDHVPAGTQVRVEGKNVTALVLRTGRPARVDDYEGASDSITAVLRDLGVRSSVGAPIVVGGRLWGVAVASTKQEEPFRPETESKIAAFTELVATAIANAEARIQISRLAEEQLALRRVATLVAQGAAPDSLFAVVAEQVARVLDVPLVSIVRYEEDGTASERASVSPQGTIFRVGTRWSLQGTNVVAQVAASGWPARIDDYSGLTGPIAEAVRGVGIRSTVASPILVAGRLWGAMVVSSPEPEPLPGDTEDRLADFTELVATAIGNSEAREEVQRLADEQGALRRVATLVAQAVPSTELFHAVAREVGTLLRADFSGLIRYEDGAMVTTVATWAAVGIHPPVPDRWPTEPGDPAAMIVETRRPARVEDWTTVPGPIATVVRDELGVSSSVGCPIVVEGKLWGALAVHSKQRAPLPPDTESRVAQFVDLVATAIANAQARAEVERLAEEQAGLRRVATLAAEGASPAAVFDAVAAEMERLLDADQVALNRFEPGDEVLVLAHRGLDVAQTPIGSRVSIDGQSATATVRRTGRPARMENYEGAGGALAELARATGLGSSVSAPIMVEGRLWGLITASWKGEESPPADTEERMTQFAELLDTAIANADSRAELVASRARLVTASDAARRRFERDLHDGVQQRLVSLSLELRGAEAMAPSENDGLAEQLAQVAKGLAEALDDLRELSRGIHPAILSQGGLGPALKGLARRSAVPVQLDLAIDQRLTEQVEVGAYYVVSEALTNATKHARASNVDVHARARDGVLELTIDDDGVGGADPARGSGLTGLVDRVEALGGTMLIASPPGKGTSLRVELALE